MVYSEHDSNFYALDKQLNREAFALDWTRSRSHTLSDAHFSGPDDVDRDLESENPLPYKLGGANSRMAASARAAAAAAAYHRWADTFAFCQESSACKRQDSDDDTAEAQGDFKHLGAVKKDELVSGNKLADCFLNQEMLEPDPDDSEAQKNMNLEPYSEVIKEVAQIEPNRVDSQLMEAVPNFTVNGRFDCANFHEEPYPDDLEASKNGVASVPISVDSQSMQIDESTNTINISEEPDPDDFETIENGVQIENNITGLGNSEEPDPDDLETRSGGRKILTSNAIDESRGDQSQFRKIKLEPDPDDSEETGIGGPQPNLGDNSEHLPAILRHLTEEPDPDDQEIRRIQDPVIVFSNRFSKAIEKLQKDLQPYDANVVLQTLFKIIRNITENPSEMKYKRLRKANPVFQRSIAYHKAAMEVLSLIGFHDDIIVDETGKTETYLVLKRYDPALLWLAKSILETHLSNCRGRGT